MPPLAVFEPAAPASERPQTQALDRAATGTGELTVREWFWLVNWKVQPLPVVLGTTAGHYETLYKNIIIYPMPSTCSTNLTPLRLIVLITREDVHIFIRQPVWIRLEWRHSQQILTQNLSRFYSLNLLNTKRRLLYLKTQFVPRSKHFSSRL